MDVYDESEPGLPSGRMVNSPSLSRSVPLKRGAEPHIGPHLKRLP